MATSGSFSGSIKDGKYKLRVDWSATQSVANNTSKITAVMYLEIASGWSLNIASRSDNTATLAGTSYTWSSPAINKGGSTTKLATVTSGNIAHNSDGSKSVTLSATFNIKATISGTYYEKITASQTVTLDTISRATTPTLSSNSVNMGSNVTITLPRESSSFTHDLAYAFAGSGYTTIKTNASTSYTWTVPDLAAKIPNDLSGVVTIRCITKNGSTTVGTKTVTMVAKVPNTAAYNPSISSVALEEAVSGLAAQFKAYIQNKSKIKATITAAGAKGSTISSISTTFLGSTYTGSTWTSAVVGSSGTLTLKTTVKDSRGRTATQSTTISVLAYTAPKVTTFEALRVNSSGVEDTEGKRLKVTYAYSVLSLNGGNTADMKIQYKTSTSSTWTTLVSSTALSGNTTYTSPSDILSSDNQYDTRMVVTDYFGLPSNAPGIIPSGEVIVDIMADGKGIGIGKVAELSGVCDVAMQTRMQGGTMHVLIPNGTNLNDWRTPGRYVGNASSNYVNPPFSNSSTFSLDVIALGAQGQVLQEAVECYAPRPRVMRRYYYSGSWGGWRSDWADLSNGVDLNTVLHPGKYRLASANTYTNAPLGNVGAMLEVMGTDTIVQRYTVASKAYSKAYERSYFSGAWGAWCKSYDSYESGMVGEIDTASAQVQITTAGIDSPVDGATLTITDGVYVIIAAATFNTGTSTGTRNIQVRLLAEGTQIARERVFAAGANFAELRTVAIYKAESLTELVCQKSSSIAEMEKGNTSITAVRIK